MTDPFKAGMLVEHVTLGHGKVIATPLGARDFIGVESFLHVVTAKRAPSTAS